MAVEQPHRIPLLWEIVKRIVEEGGLPLSVAALRVVRDLVIKILGKAAYRLVPEGLLKSVHKPTEGPLLGWYKKVWQYCEKCLFAATPSLDPPDLGSLG